MEIRSWFSKFDNFYNNARDHHDDANNDIDVVCVLLSDLDSWLIVGDDNMIMILMFAIQSSTSLPRGNQVDGLPRVCSRRALSRRVN